MSLAPSNVLGIARKWQKRESKILGYLAGNSFALQIDFAGRLAVDGNMIRVVSDEGLEFRVVVLPELTYRYGDALLEIKGSGWRCVLYEPKD